MDDSKHMISCSKTAYGPFFSIEMFTALITFTPKNSIEYRTDNNVVIDVNDSLKSIAEEYGNEHDINTANYLFNNNFDYIEFTNV